MANNVAVVFKKEWLDAVRDKRSLRMAFMPAIYFVGTLVMLFYMMLYMSDAQQGIVETPIAIEGKENFPTLINWLVERGAIVEGVSSAEQWVIEGKQPFVLVIPPEAESKYYLGQRVDLKLYFDAVNQQKSTRLQFVQSEIQQLNNRLAAVNILARGVSPQLLQPIAIEQVNVASDRKMGTFVIGSMPMMIVMLAFIAGIGFSIDMTAGERERRSLESLLITPASSASIVIGKALVSVLITICVLCFTLSLLQVVIYLLPFHLLGFTVSVGFIKLALIFIDILPLVFLAVGLQFAIALYARSFKDAQTIVGITIVLPVLPGLYVMFNPAVSAEWMYWVPVLSQLLFCKSALTSEAVSLWQLVASWITSLPLAILLLSVTAAQIRSAKFVR